MSVKRRVVRALDVRGGRAVLGWIATMRARRLLGQRSVTIAYRGVWVHRLERYLMPDGPRFDYDDRVILSWRDQEGKYRRNAT